MNLSSEIVSPGWQLPVSALWIDGDHSYNGVQRDYQQWRPHFIDGAFVAFDDATDEDLGPYRLIAELIERKELQHCLTAGKIVLMRYTK